MEKAASILKSNRIIILRLYNQKVGVCEVVKEMSQYTFMHGLSLKPETSKKLAYCQEVAKNLPKRVYKRYD